MIVDGGPSGTYHTALRPRIERWAKSTRRRPRIDLLVVTHIDNDHIIGALELLKDTTLDVEIGQIWFNGWDQIAPRDQMGVKEGIELSKWIKKRGIKHNSSFKGCAAMVNSSKPGKKYRLPGGLVLTVVSPGDQQIVQLRKKWDKVVAELKAKKAVSADVLGEKAGEPDVEALAAARFQSDDAPANGSSLAIIAEYEGKRILLAGDSFATVVADTLETLGYSRENPLILDAYKMSHHGSRGNNNIDLLRLLKCSNYLFSTSGKRFKHPHDECVARVLVDGGTPLSIHSNYRRGPALLWNLKEVFRDFPHRLLQPEPGNEGLSIDL